MNDIRSFIVTARERGVIDEGIEQQLNSLNDELTSAPTDGNSGFFAELNCGKYAADEPSFEDREAPRLIRGFHDILITIGIVIALGGLWSLSNAIFVVVAIIGLAELFVRKQRLALPAFTLTVMLLLAVGSIFSYDLGNEYKAGILFFVAQLVALAAFYWRYRVPVALAGLIWFGFGLVFVLALALFSDGRNLDGMARLYPRLVGLLGLVLTLGMFFVGMRFDMKDRLRKTRRSDVAFWLHLATAPLLLYSMFFILFGDNGFWWSGTPSISEAMTAIGLVTLMVLVGIIIDRRAFVTSGLISLGAALAIITRETGLDVSSVSAFAFMAVGIIVLLLGSGWQTLRGFILAGLPEGITGKVPPVQN